MYFAASM